MKIGITINEVVRNYHERLQLIYEKYNLGESKILDIEELTDINLLDYYFPLSDTSVAKSIDDLRFNKVALEIAGHAKITDENFIDSYHKFIYDFLDYKDNKIEFVSKERNRSINATLFFFSKTNINVRNIKFVDDYTNIWDEYDVIITTEPDILTSAPLDKTPIKIETFYNSAINTKLTYNKISDVFESDILKQI